MKDVKKTEQEQEQDSNSVVCRLKGTLCHICLVPEPGRRSENKQGKEL